MRFCSRSLPALGLLLGLVSAAIAQENEQRYLDKIDVNVPHVSTDKSVKYDYDIVYVRAPRAGDKDHRRFYLDFSSPVVMEPGADLMLLHPDGREELLVAGGEGSVTDPMVSLDGQWCYYVHIHKLKDANQWTPPAEGADIYKVHLKDKKIVRLTNQKFSPNTGAAKWTANFRHDPANPHDNERTHMHTGVYNMGPCPIGGGKIVFTSNRDGFKPAKGYPAIALQLFVMDDRDESIGDDEDPTNLEKIGHLNISGALHPVALKDGRIMFSSLESQGIRGDILWGLWTIHPDGSKWNPLVSAFDPGGAPNGFHFQSQLSDGSIVFEEYYNQNNSGFGALMKMPAAPPDDQAAFGPADMRHERNKAWRFGRHDNGTGRYYRMPFMPTGSESLTPFAFGFEGPADPSIPGDKDSPKVGKFTHPSGAPDNHLLTIYSPGPVNHQYTYLPQLDGGIYLIKDGEVIEQPSQMLLIKNDPQYNESWPRAVVTYEQIYGVKEPAQLARVANDGKASPHLPEGTPFGLIGSSSLYKRESYPNGVVPDGKTTAECPAETYKNDPWKGLDAFTSHGNGMPINWHNQGADAGLYTNDEIVALRILFMEPTTDRQRGGNQGKRFHNHANERLRIAGEIPVRKFKDKDQPRDIDGNPDTSFLAKIPADTAFTFQTIDKDGVVLNMSQTWHQLRPGEVRHDCGGCHAHSQKPTLFEDTLAAKPDYKVWDLTAGTPLLTAKASDETKQQWNADDSVGLKTLADEVVNVEYFRDVKPILARTEQRKVKAGFAREDLFVCVHEQFMTATAKMADVVLPATMFLEHDDLYQGGGHQYIILGPKLREAPGECWSNHDVICGLAKRVGAEHPGFAKNPQREIIDWTLQKSGWGTLAELEEKKWIDCQPDFNTAHYVEGFRYPDKKFRFKPDWANVPAPRSNGIRIERDVPRLPDHWDVIEKADAKHPFRLSTSPSRDYLNSSFNETPSSQAKHGKPRVKVHPQDLADLGIADGARVRMGNERGEIVLPAEAFAGVQRGVVIVESIAPNDHFEGGEGINTLTSSYQAAPYGGAAFHDNHVWIEKA